jgi:hypothetical protein
MRTIHILRRVPPFVAAIVLLCPIAPSRAQGLPDNDRPVTVTFEKWPIPGSATPYSLMAGVTGGDITGTYVGEVLHRVMSQAQPNHTRVIWLEAMYEIQAGDRSFTALIRGGTNSATGAAVLDGVVLAGWRTGAPVHVEFQTKPAPSASLSGCVAVTAPPGVTCFQGTIHVGRVPTSVPTN